MALSIVFLAGVAVLLVLILIALAILKKTMDIASAVLQFAILIILVYMILKTAGIPLP